MGGGNAFRYLLNPYCLLILEKIKVFAFTADGSDDGSFIRSHYKLKCISFYLTLVLLFCNTSNNYFLIF